MASCLLALVALAVLSPQQPGGELRPKRSGGASSLVDGDVDDFAGLRRVHLTQAVDDSTPSPPPNGYARLVSPSPYPPPPPAPTPPNSPPPVIIGEDVGLPIALTGNVRVDAHNIALIDGLHELEHRWEPILATVLAVVLFCIHNLVVADNEYFSTDTRQEGLTPLMSQLIVYGNARPCDSIYLVSFYFSNGEWRRNLHQKSKVSFQLLFLDASVFRAYKE